ncbi:MAG: aminodeoxychorismate synthase component I [Deltaproteobacteria bacterium]|nr:aminodeoxychorismate synthase component I [Deltaproteobacteria bacterium]
MDPDLARFLALPAHRVHRLVEVAVGPLHELLALIPNSVECALLDSARAPGRCSYLTIGAELVVSATREPVLGRPDLTHVVVERGGRRWEKVTDPLSVLRAIFELRGRTDFPGSELVSGAIGYLGYELGRAFERLTDLDRAREVRPLRPPDLRFVFNDAIFIRDETTGSTRLSVIGRGGSIEEAEADAERRAAHFLSSISGPRTKLAPGSGSLVESSHARESYELMVDRVKEAILEGDVFEVCVTQQLSSRFAADGPAVCVYAKLRELSAAPYAAYLRFGDFETLSASPELFLSVGLDGVAISRPIKGTRPRGRTKEEDRELELELGTSIKDRAENVMIVDLVRNDLGRVCQPGSVEVPELCVVETHPTVFQLVSTVSGRLRPDADGLELIRACFPGGSMTGAPKIEAMKIIETLEPVERGIYSGALGYIDDRGNLQLSIVIRTLVRAGRRVSLGVGGAVVADSNPSDEYEESMVKARAPLFALGAALDEPRRAGPPAERNPVQARPAKTYPTNGTIRSGARVLILDHYDSFTYNLAQLVGRLTGALPRVARCDELSYSEILALDPTHVILSPGPGRGDDPGRLGVSFEVIRRFDGPILGVCLGLQAIGHAFGARVVRAPQPRHGKTSDIHHVGSGIYSGLPNPFSAMRYHSLVVSDLPEHLLLEAWTSDGIVMGLRHRDRPVQGVQFHPESVGTPLGELIVRRFLEVGISRNSRE